MKESFEFRFAFRAFESKMLVNSFSGAFLIFVIIVELSLGGCVLNDASHHSGHPLYHRRRNIVDRRNYFALQRNAIVNLTDLGVLQGSVEETKWTRTPIYRFLGIKYAESPSGNRRFKVN